MQKYEARQQASVHANKDSDGKKSYDAVAQIDENGF